uniref:Uncharacterized protein n=1 Tax=Romanomermis culicivorax TaxID=13658 RepID=A0A915IFY6_ROMCU
MCHNYQCSGNRNYYKNRVVQETSRYSGNCEFKALVGEGRGKGIDRECGCSGNRDTIVCPFPDHLFSPTIPFRRPSLFPDHPFSPTNAKNKYKKSPFPDHPFSPTNVINKVRKSYALLQKLACKKINHNDVSTATPYTCDIEHKLEVECTKYYLINRKTPAVVEEI